VTVTIDRSIRRLLPPDAPSVGPVFLPISQTSVEYMVGMGMATPKRFDLSFIGAIYPNRAAVLDELRRAGLNVAVNPHRVAGRDRAGYAEYVRALAGSRLTINFARCSGPPIDQLKSRLLEAALAGAVIINDEDAQAGSVFTPGMEFLVARTPADLAAVAGAALADPARLVGIREAALSHSRAIAPVEFWERLDEALQEGTTRGFNPLRSGGV
jgi:hypothetical protein